MGELILSKDDNGKRLKISCGDKLIINLKQLAGAGYDWEIFGLNSELIEDQSINGTAVDRNAIGGSGLRKFIFAVKKKGITRLLLRHRRPWDPENISIDEFAITLEIE